MIDGTVERVAATPEEFQACVNQRRWQEDHLLSQIVARLHAQGKVPAKGECYGFKAHPAFAGKADVDLIQVVNMRVWQSFCAQIFGSKAKGE